MNKYFVSLTLILGDIEKTAKMVVRASDETEAGKQALIGECHGDPDFEEFPDFDACWDMGENIYRVNKVELLTDEEYKVLNKYI